MASRNIHAKPSVLKVASTTAAEPTAAPVGKAVGQAVGPIVQPTEVISPSDGEQATEVQATTTTAIERIGHQQILPGADLAGFLTNSPEDVAPLQRRSLDGLSVEALLRRAAKAYGAIATLVKKSAEQVWFAGEALAAAKKQITDGTYTAQIEAHGISASTARQAVRLYKDNPDPVSLRGKSITDAKNAAGITKPKAIGKAKPKATTTDKPKPDLRTGEPSGDLGHGYIWRCLAGGDDGGPVEIVGPYWDVIAVDGKKAVTTDRNEVLEKADGICHTRHDALLVMRIALQTEVDRLQEGIAAVDDMIAAEEGTD